MSHNLREDLYFSVYSHGKISLLDFLNALSYDELTEFNLKTDEFRQLFHVEGKYMIVPSNTSHRELYEFSCSTAVHPQDREAYAAFLNPDGLEERLKKARIPNFDSIIVRFRLQNGSYRYVEQCIITGKENGIEEGLARTYIFDVHNFVSRQLGSVGAASSLGLRERDDMTGLLTGKEFLSAANEKLKNESDRRWCLVSIDIEHFLFFNEWFGQDKGDYLLSQIGELLRSFGKECNGISGYFGHDDFVVLAPFDLAEIESLYECIRDLILSFGLSFGFMPAFGVAEIGKGMLVSDVFDHANVALRKAKADIKNRIIVYNPSIRFKTEEEFRILSEFMRAFQKGEVTFYLQPQVRVSTGKIVGAEALARWVRPDGSIVLPGDFIPLLERYGFIIDLDQYIWERVCIWIREQLDLGHTPCPISVNVSRSDIFSVDVHKYFIDLTAKYNIPHHLVKLEITESAYTDTTDVIESLVNKLRKDGFMVLMDDFGSGYSSLNMLSSLKVDAIKLDANFLHIEDADYEKGIHILESVINMAKQIALPIIVEGVETKTQCDFLEEMGCRYVQGFFFYRPMSKENFASIIGDKKMIDPRGFVAKLNDQFRIREFLDRNIYSDVMLNNIIGAVALYSWHDNHVDIVRFNQQFYEAVNVPDFHERLVDIERFLPDEDKPKIFNALKHAMQDKLLGAKTMLRFGKIDGTYAFFSVHYYYLGKKEGGERFYGSAVNISELQEKIEERRLIAEYSDENIIFIRRIYDKWHYTVASHGMGNLFDLTAEQFEAELNEGKFAKRVAMEFDGKNFMMKAAQLAAEKKDFSFHLPLIDKNGDERDVELDYTYVGDKADNILYLLRPRLID